MSDSLTVAAQREQANYQTGALGVYVHVPFCATTCDYCAFYQVRPERDDFVRYLAAIEREFSLLPVPLAAETVFWGGGTPGLLPPDRLAELCSIVRRHLAAPAREWSVEMAPTTVTRERLDALKAGGVTRISLGVQSLQPGLLDALGRRHSQAQVLRAYELIREVGFASVNLDLIFAVPGQDAALWRRDLEAAIALEPDHLSTYCLTFEEDTALFVKLSQGKVSIDVEKETLFYETAWDVLGAAGFAQYEISNYARPGHACRHNLNTWSMQEWIGLGPSGASQHAGWRYSNPADLRAWQTDLAAGKRGTADRVALNPNLLAEDSLIFGLRCNAGVDFAALATRFPTAPWAEYRRLADRFTTEGLAVWAEPDRLWLTPRGRMLADAVGEELLGVEAG